tara:strand:- start:1979 stop:2545 length:567 start_codon:yes stop_codon:yes gene_type:complete
VTFITDSVNYKVILKEGQIPDVDWDPYLTEIENDFIIEAKKSGVIIPEKTRNKLRHLKFVEEFSTPKEKGVAATCTRYSVYDQYISGITLTNQEKKWLSIEVLRPALENYTKNLNENEKKRKTYELIFHELFHCYLDKGHLPQNYDGVMNPVLDSSSRRAIDHWDALVEEMFSPTYLSIIPDVDLEEL